MHHFLVGMGLCALAAGDVSATTYQITGVLSGEGVSNYGNLVLTYDATGQPIANQDDIATAVSNVNATASLSTYYSDQTFVVSGTHGSGDFAVDNGAPYPPDSYCVFDFAVGPMEGEFHAPAGFNGTGPIFSNDGDVPSFVAIDGARDADGSYIFSGSSAPVGTPEPESLSLLFSGLSMSGLAWGTAKGRLVRSL